MGGVYVCVCVWNGRLGGGLCVRNLWGGGYWRLGGGQKVQRSFWLGERPLGRPVLPALATRIVAAQAEQPARLMPSGGPSAPCHRLRVRLSACVNPSISTPSNCRELCNTGGGRAAWGPPACGRQRPLAAHPAQRTLRAPCAPTVRRSAAVLQGWRCRRRAPAAAGRRRPRGRMCMRVVHDVLWWGGSHVRAGAGGDIGSSLRHACVAGADAGPLAGSSRRRWRAAGAAQAGECGGAPAVPRRACLAPRPPGRGPTAAGWR